MAVTIDEIRNTIRGCSKEEIEALLVNRDDFNLLCQSIHLYNGLIHDPTINEVRFYDVKIIESPYVQNGTIYKLFKNKNFYMGDTIAESGVVNNNPSTFIDPACLPESGSMPIVSPSELKQSIDEQSSGQISIPQLSVVKNEKPDDKEEEKEIRKRYSTTRKIELGE